MPITTENTPRLLAKAALCLSLTATLLAGFRTAAIAETPAEMAQLNQGQVLVKEMPSAVKGGLPAVEARILLNEPPESAWPVVANPAKLMSFEPKVKKAQIVSRTANAQDVDFSVVMTRLFPAFNYRLRQELTPNSGIKFYRVSGAFKDIQGGWKLTPSDGGKKTILSYTLKVDAGPMIPKGLIMNAVKSDLPNMMRNVKKAIDQN